MSSKLLVTALAVGPLMFGATIPAGASLDEDLNQSAASSARSLVDLMNSHRKLNVQSRIGTSDAQSACPGAGCFSAAGNDAGWINFAMEDRQNFLGPNNSRYSFSLVEAVARLLSSDVATRLSSRGESARGESQ